MSIRNRCVCKNKQNNLPIINSTFDTIDSVIIKAIDELNYGEIKSMLLLLMHDVQLRNYFSLINEPKEKLIICLKRTIQQKYSPENHKLLLSELLTIIKRYDLIKQFGLCKHNVSNMKFYIVKPYWKMFYHICESLNDNELDVVKQRYSIHPSLTYGEDVMCCLHVSGHLAENRVSDEFNQALCKIQPKIVDFIRNYFDEIRQEDRYYIRDPQQNNHCGLAIIINQQVFSNSDFKERPGSKIDKDKLEDLWNSFGFKTEVFENLKAEEIQKLFEDLYHRQDTDFDIFVSCILSHGEAGVIYGADCKAVEIESLIDSTCRCSYLYKKPKLFFIQACQGQQHHEGSFPVNTDVHSDSVAINLNDHSERDNRIARSDVYKVVSTIPGYVSYCSPTLGGLFIEKLVEKLKEDGDKMELQSIMTKVSQSSSTRGPVQQMPITSSTLRKHVIFKRMFI